MVDNVFKSRLVYQEHEDKLYHELTQPTEDLILKRNAELRKNNVLNDLSFGRWAASIPLNVYEKALRDGYQMNSKDNEIRQREIMRFLKSEEGKKCLVQDKV